MLLLSCVCCAVAQDTKDNDTTLERVAKDENETLARTAAVLDEPDMDELMMFFTFPTISFTAGKSDISEDQTASIQQVANYMKDNPKNIVIVKGIATSALSNTASTLMLARDRAKAVVDILTTKMGIEAERLRIETTVKQVSPNDDNTARVVGATFVNYSE